MAMRSPQTLTPNEWAIAQGLPYYTVLRLCRRGEILAFKVGRRVRIPVAPPVKRRTLTITELANRWQVHRSTVHTILARQELRNFKKNGSRRIVLASVAGYERRHLIGG